MFDRLFARFRRKPKTIQAEPQPPVRPTPLAIVLPLVMSKPTIMIAALPDGILGPWLAEQTQFLRELYAAPRERRN